jgi:hypothetical protein
VRTGLIAESGPGEGAERRYIRGRVPTPPAGTSGAVGRADVASADKGEAIFTRFVDTLAAALSSGA